MKNFSDISASEANKSEKKSPSKCKFISVGLLIGLLIGAAVTLGVYFGLPPRGSSNDNTEGGGSSSTVLPRHGIFGNAAVAADAGICSTMGKGILEKKGSVVDAYITTALCVGVVQSHSCGIGGGHFAVYFDAKTEKATFINGRETAPKSANETMFVNSTKNPTLGGHAVGVPGEIHAMWESHQRYGKLKWAELIEPVIEICANGYNITAANAKAINSVEKYIRDPAFNLWPFLNDDGSLKKEGELIRRPQLANTFKKIASEGAATFYNGSLAKDIIADLEEAYLGTSITAEDLSEYKTLIEDAVSAEVGDLTVYSAGLPGSGPVLCLMLNILDGYNMSPEDLKGDNKELTYHRIIEAFRFAYAKRSALGDDRNNKTITELASNMTKDWFADDIRMKITDKSHNVAYYQPEFDVPASYGTSHLSIIDEEGNAVGATTTINTYFGSKVRGSRTGIIFNNEMDDFSTPGLDNSYGVPPSPSNFIQPGNRPQSSMTPTIVVENNGGKPTVKMVAGASGGTKITTGTAQTLMNALWFGMNTDDSVQSKRLHDQLMPDYVQYETGFDEDVLESLRKRDHIVKETASYSVVQAIRRTSDGKLDAACDLRKGGYPDGF